jgi:tetratricopeptide (TPR) repeat protein
MGDIARAMADLDRAVGLAPANHRGYFVRGLANSRRGEKLLALADYDKALTIYPTYADALVSRSAIYAADGTEDLALRDLDAAIAVQTNNPIAFYNRGYVHFAKREYDLAVADYDAAIILDPKMGSAYGNRCLVRAITGKDLPAALSDCDVALKLMPTNPDVRETRGFLYMKLGEPLVAVVEYNAALERDPNRTIALYGRGMAKIKAGDRKEGEADQAAARRAIGFRRLAAITNGTGLPLSNGQAVVPDHGRFRRVRAPHDQPARNRGNQASARQGREVRSP